MRLFQKKIFLICKKKICNVMYPVELEKKKVIGVTGTNGKTSVCHFLSEILSHMGYSVLSVGTLGEGLRTPAGYRMLGCCGLTTPGHAYLKKLFFQHKDSFDFVVMELSSHALQQDRLGDVKIDLGVWTNFSRDHLDYHKNMEDYFLAKSKIFDCLKPAARVLIHKRQHEVLDRLDASSFSKIMLYDNHESLFLRSNGASPLFKGFMLKNIGAALGSIEALLEQKVECLDFLTPPPGRFNVLQKEQKTVVVDYAHTPDALENLICMAREHFSGKKISVLFGCGGERDVGKRAKMGEVAQKYADKIYLTSDNPRSEDPAEILEHIKLSLTRPFMANVDRKEMIETAIDDMKRDEVLLVAGKGHERCQDINGVKYPFNDLEIVRDCL